MAKSKLDRLLDKEHPTKEDHEEIVRLIEQKENPTEEELGCLEIAKKMLAFLKSEEKPAKEGDPKERYEKFLEFVDVPTKLHLVNCPKTEIEEYRKLRTEIENDFDRLEELEKVMAIIKETPEFPWYVDIYKNACEMIVDRPAFRVNDSDEELEKKFILIKKILGKEDKK